MATVDDMRVKIGLVRNAKYRRLRRRVPDAAHHLLSLWSYAAENHPSGVFPLDAETVALAADWDGEPQEIVTALLEAGGGDRPGFLVQEDSGYRLHDWDDHQGWIFGVEARRRKARHAAIAKHHGRERADLIMAAGRDSAVSCSKDATSMPGACPEHARSSAPSPSPSPSPNPEEPPKPPAAAGGGSFDRFWSAYPRRVGKQAARRAWRRRRPPIDRVLAALAWQVRTEQWREGYVPNPATWLNQGRWEDEPPVRERGKGDARRGPGDPWVTSRVGPLQEAVFRDPRARGLGRHPVAGACLRVLHQARPRDGPIEPAEESWTPGAELVERAIALAVERGSRAAARGG